jgi:hypothetical protein
VISVGLDHGGKRAASLDDYGQLVDPLIRRRGVMRNAKRRRLAEFIKFMSDPTKRTTNVLPDDRM